MRGDQRGPHLGGPGRIELLRGRRRPAGCRPAPRRWARSARRLIEVWLVRAMARLHAPANWSAVGSPVRTTVAPRSISSPHTGQRRVVLADAPGRRPRPVPGATAAGAPPPGRSPSGHRTTPDLGAGAELHRVGGAGPVVHLLGRGGVALDRRCARGSARHSYPGPSRSCTRPTNSVGSCSSPTKCSTETSSTATGRVRSRSAHRRPRPAAPAAVPAGHH